MPIFIKWWDMSNKPEWLAEIDFCIYLFIFFVIELFLDRNAELQ